MEAFPLDDNGATGDRPDDGFLGGTAWRVAGALPPVINEKLPESITMPSQSLKAMRPFSMRPGYYKQEIAKMPAEDSGLRVPGEVARTTGPDNPGGV